MFHIFFFRSFIGLSQFFVTPWRGRHTAVRLSLTSIYYMDRRVYP